MFKFAIFFGVLSLVAGLAHYYILQRMLKLSVLPQPWLWPMLFLLLGLMLSAPFWQRLAPDLGRIPLFIGYSWMGFLWLLLVATFMGDVLRLLQWSMHYWLNVNFWLKGQALLYGFAVIAGFWGMYQALKVPPLKHVKIEIKNLPPAFEGYKIVQLTDTHLGPILRKSWAEQVAKRVSSVQADLLVHTGDLVDGQVAQISASVSPLLALRGKDGQYYITGNHESYSGLRTWVQFVADQGWSVLDNRHIWIEKEGQKIALAGVTDAHEGQMDPARQSRPDVALAGIPVDSTVIFLAHQPLSALAAQNFGVDLQLSGHTHGGQIWPFHYLVYLQQPIRSGLGKVGDVLVYVSNGAGFWGPPFRLGAPAEITVLELVPAP